MEDFLMRVSVTKLQGGGGFHCEAFAPNIYSMNAFVNAAVAIVPTAGEVIPPAHAAVVDIEHPTTGGEARAAEQLAAATDGPVLNVVGADQE